LPGPGCIYMGQTFKFVKPAYLNEEIEATVELIRARKEKKIFFFETICRNEKNEILLSGEAVVYAPNCELEEE
jgi:acyl dehydratase